MFNVNPARSRETMTGLNPSDCNASIVIINDIQIYRACKDHYLPKSQEIGYLEGAHIDHSLSEKRIDSGRLPNSTFAHNKYGHFINTLQKHIIVQDNK
jgi:hypothetical protein